MYSLKGLAPSFCTSVDGDLEPRALPCGSCAPVDDGVGSGELPLAVLPVPATRDDNKRLHLSTSSRTRFGVSMLFPRLRFTLPADMCAVLSLLLSSRERFECAVVEDCETGAGNGKS
jgi:hypothetical protein